jgi:hypothetical protein
MPDAPLDLAAEAPKPPPLDYARALIERAGGAYAVARILSMKRRSVARIISGERPMSWAAAELLRRELLKP